jgi:hypothetical protein
LSRLRSTLHRTCAVQLYVPSSDFSSWFEKEPDCCHQSGCSLRTVWP